MLLHLVLFDKTVMVTLLASIFVYVLLRPGVEVTACFANVNVNGTVVELGGDKMPCVRICKHYCKSL